MHIPTSQNGSQAAGRFADLFGVSADEVRPAKISFAGLFGRDDPAQSHQPARPVEMRGPKMFRPRKGRA